MANSFSALYGDYKKNIMSLMAGNEFYENLFGVASTGENNFSLFNRYFEKKIDLRWVDAIEECIVPLDTIIRNPRKFIVQEEEIVPIERARKITAESVRHLAQHTSMIARVDGDRVTPSKILNVFREESFEIYENRFIYTLLRNLQHFIDTRYNVLFSMADDENMSSMKMESLYNAGGEQITFKLEISTQAGSNHKDENVETDPKNASALARIERIKRIINEFAHSAFMRDLQGCTPVRPPIMRTNVISKDPNFRACLNLWQFISSYNEVGYEILTKETNDMISDEYKEDMFRMFSANYMLLKKNFIPEEEHEPSKLKKRKIKPKMLKRLAEELVMDYDLEEVEIRKVFVDEMKRVAKKKAAGEQKIKDAIARALNSENERKAEIEARIKAEIQRQKEIEKRRKEREAARIAKEKALEKERIAREKAKAKAKKEKELALEKERIRKEKEKERIARAKAKEAERIAKEKELQRIKKEKERQEKLKAIEEAKKLKAKQLEEQRKAKALALEMEKKEKEKARIKAQKEREAARKAEQLAKEKAAKAAQREKERLARQKAAELEKEKAAAARQKEKERLAKQKAEQAEKERIAREKLKEKERLAREKAAQIAKEKAAAARQKEKERAAKEKAAQAAKEKAAREKAKAKQQGKKQSKPVDTDTTEAE